MAVSVGLLDYLVGSLWSYVFRRILQMCEKLCFVGNFSDTDIGEPIVDVILEPGDLLYFPRGTIHQVRDLVSRQSTFCQ